MAELIIGRHTKANPVKALQAVSGDSPFRTVGTITGFAGLVTAGLILGFYGIIAGWMASHALGSLAELVGGLHRSARVDVGPQPIERIEQRLT